MAKKIGFILGPLLFILIYNVNEPIINPEATKVIAIAIWMIIWWVAEVVSISVTALIPLVFYPPLDIMSLKETAQNFAHPIIYLFFGGFVMALALEKVNLHKRIALNIIKATGTSPNKVVLGFMIATAMLSTFISNTATTLVMVPIALSVLHILLDKEHIESKHGKYFALTLMLGIAYSANIGGIATIIGTPPNVILVGFLEEQYHIHISFLHWMAFGIPFSMLMLSMMYVFLVKVIYPNTLVMEGKVEKMLNKELQALGKISREEKRVMLVFIFTMLLWISKKYINLFLHQFQLSDAGISLLASFILFCIPIRPKQMKYILSWEDTKALPWGILILFGGGLALAKGLSKTGIINVIGEVISAYNTLSPIIIGVILICIVLFMTELMSNVALVAVFCPVVAGIAMGLDHNILYFLIPITMASSCAFMLPMATPPNAIVFASKHVKVKDMVRIGFILNTIAIMLLSLFMAYILPLVFKD